jgi:2-polyprenyl-3-methyl-5-hydroxy-6-metoxy-1,4-benzoquinol methylase
MGYTLREPTSRPDEPPVAWLKWEEVNCLLCGSRRWDTLLEAPDHQGGTGLWFAVVQCNDCGLCFTNPRPRQEILDRFYPADYRPHQTHGEKARGPLHGGLRKLWPKRLRLPPTGQGRLLDFGCGGGTLLRQLHEQGWQVLGMDVSPEVVERVQAETGLPVLLGTLPHAELTPHSFDLITMWHSLEHVPDPLSTLREAQRLLVPGGKVMVVAPNIDSLAFRTFGQAWFGLDLPRHFTHFAPWTLHFMLERAGFRHIRIRMVRQSSWIRHSARLACRQTQAQPIHFLMKSKALSRFLAFYSCLTGQSDCMMATATRGEV